MPDLDFTRQHMVDAQIARRGVRDPRVLAAMRAVPRESFVEKGFEEFAYEDAPLPIAQGQTISQPYIVARMIEAAEIDASDRVLEVGTGSGYAAAVLSLVAKIVFSIERHAGLAETAGRRLAMRGYHNVEIRVGDGTKGWPEAAPFDAILVTAGGPTVPGALKQQLAIGGRLIIPVGKELGSQRLVRITRMSETAFEDEDLGGVMFVPLIGEHGWQESGRAEIATRARSVPRLIAIVAEALPDFDDSRFGEIFDRFGDLYNMSGSIAAVLRYLDEVDPASAAVARERYGCLTPWQNEPSTYGRAVLSARYRKCEEAIVAQCRDLLKRELDYAGKDADSFLDAAQNARLIAAAEKYYRVMYYGGAESWNLRDRHMFETLENILEAKGPDAKAIVWAHNSHIGDARFTEMGEVRGELNIGQLCRERFGEEAALIGFGTHSGPSLAPATGTVPWK